MFLIALSPVLAQQETTDDIMPDKVFRWYVFDILPEKVKLLFASEERKVEIYGEIMEERIAEEEMMREQGKEKALERVKKHTNLNMENIMKHMTVLEERKQIFLETNNTKAVKGITNAINNSQKVIFKMMEKLEKRELMEGFEKTMEVSRIRSREIIRTLNQSMENTRIMIREMNRG